MDRIITKAKYLKKEFYTSLTSISENKASFPDAFFTAFEIKRCEFDNKGYLSKPRTSTSRVIIAGITLIRSFVYKAILQSELCQDEQKKKMIASILYETIME